MKRHDFNAKKAITLIGKNGFTRIINFEKFDLIEWYEVNENFLPNDGVVWVHHRNMGGRSLSVPLESSSFGLTQKELLKQFGVNE